MPKVPPPFLMPVARTFVAMLLMLGLYASPLALADEAASSPPKKTEAEAPATENVQVPANEAPEAKVQKPEKLVQLSEERREALEHYNEGVRLFLAAQQDATLNPRASRDLMRDAEKQFKKAIRADDTLVEAYSNLAYVYLGQGKHWRARRSFEQALERNPGHVVTLAGYAITQSAMNNSQKAIEILVKLTKIEPDNARHWFNLGTVLQRNKRYKEAAEAYREALLREPKHQPSMFNMATLHHQQKEYKEAWTYYKRCIQTNPGSPLALQAQRRLDALQQELGQSPEALEAQQAFTPPAI